MSVHLFFLVVSKAHRCSSQIAQLVLVHNYGNHTAMSQQMEILDDLEWALDFCPPALVRRFTRSVIIGAADMSGIRVRVLSNLFARHSLDPRSHVHVQCPSRDRTYG
jgi:hypothetical protein